MNPDRSAAVAQLAQMIVRVERSHPVRVAIDGVDAAGKTTLGDDLVPAIRGRARPCIRASLADFLRPPADRHARGRSSAVGYYQDAFDYQAVQARLLEPLGPGGDRRYQTRIWNRPEERVVDSSARVAPRDAVVLVDGVFLQRPELRGGWDFVVWVDVREQVAFARAVIRDRPLLGPKVRDLYLERYLPAQQTYQERVRPAERAHVRFVNDDPDHPRVITNADRLA